MCQHFYKPRSDKPLCALIVLWEHFKTMTWSTYRPNRHICFMLLIAYIIFFTIMVVTFHWLLLIYNLMFIIINMNYTFMIRTPTWSIFWTKWYIDLSWNYFIILLGAKFPQRIASGSKHTPTQPLSARSKKQLWIIDKIIDKRCDISRAILLQC